MNGAVMFLMMVNNNGRYGRGSGFLIPAIDQPDDHFDYSADASRRNGCMIAALLVLLPMLLFMMVVLYEVIVVGNKTWPA